MRDKIFYSTAFGIAFGVLLRSFVFISLPHALFLGLISLVLLLVFSLIVKNKLVIVLIVFFLAFSFGIFRFHLADSEPPKVLESQVSQIVFLEGKVVDEPEKRETNQRLTVLVSKEVKILATTDLYANFRYGDNVSFSGKLEKPENFYTDYGKNFDYINYLRKDGIFYLVKYPKIEILERGTGNKVKQALFALKEKFLGQVNHAVLEPESLLLGGLILGEKASFSETMRQSFVDTGTIHIVALSGYNVTIVAEWIMKIFSFLPRTVSFGAGILGILLFIIMTGGSSTAVRAGIMAVLALIARATGRTYDVGRALVLAGVVMILINPFVLAFDVSFALSFIATVAVIFLAPKLEKYFLWIKWKWLRDIISITFAAYIFVLPFILYKMGNLSLVALPANILILPFIPLTMVLGFLTGFAGFIYSALGVPFGLFSYFLLHYELAIIGFFSRLPFAAFAIPNFPLVLTLLIYGIFVWKLFGKDLRKLFNT